MICHLERNVTEITPDPGLPVTADAASEAADANNNHHFTIKHVPCELWSSHCSTRSGYHPTSVKQVVHALLARISSSFMESGAMGRVAYQPLLPPLILLFRSAGSKHGNVTISGCLMDLL